jgi:DNA processing protein
MQSAGVQAICIEDEKYPQILKEIADAPLVLYIKGSPECLVSPAVAIVGSRRASLYGMGMAQVFAAKLAESGLTVVSGMARGIDTAAHQGAIKAGGVTIAVLGCGLNYVYPPENDLLAKSIFKTGAVISEFPMETPPASFNFPRRNRIISGLSRGVLVVEAALKSGALITSDFALEQGREVFALPGKIGDSSSQGTNKLIQQGAKLTTSVEDILTELAAGLQMYRVKNEPAAEEAIIDENLSSEEKMLCETLSDVPLHIDELSDKTGMNIAQAAMVLFKLELKKLVRQLPGQKYQKHSRGHNGKIFSHR